MELSMKTWLIDFLITNGLTQSFSKSQAIVLFASKSHGNTKIVEFYRSINSNLIVRWRGVAVI